MLPILFAGLSALLWGSGDFAGGKAAQLGRPLAVTVVSQLLALPLLGLCLVMVPGTPSGTDLVWGAVAGCAGVAGMPLLYRALAGGAMAVVAPVTAVTAAVIPITIGLFTDRSPGGLALGGVGLAIVAIALVSIGPDDRHGATSGRLLGLALGAGALFGVFFALLGQSSAEAGMWPLLAARVSSIGLGVAAMVATRTSFRFAPGSFGWVAAAGLLDSIGNVCYLAAATRGHLSIVAAIASLYPASTVWLALLIERERLRIVQFAGLGVAVAALVFVAV